MTEARSTQHVCFGALICGLAYSALCIGGRAGSIWPLEWMEGASVMHAQRLVHGLPLYAAPRADFIPFVYPPLSYVPMALGLLLSGGALWGARLASIFALALCGLALFRAAERVSGSRSAGALAAGLFFFGYSYCGAFIDLARVDAWFCALSLWGVERLCARRSLQGLLLLALACFAKQHAVLLLAAASCGVLYSAKAHASARAGLGEALPRSFTPVHGGAAHASRPPEPHAFERMRWVSRLGGGHDVALAWLALALGCVLLSAASDGWFWTYCVRVPERHGLDPRLLASFVFVDLFVYLPLLSALCLWSVVKRSGEQALLLHLLLTAALVASALGRAHPGGDDNVRLPAYALAALVAAISCVELLRLQPRWRWAMIAALGFQLAMLLQPPNLHWPTRQSDQSFMQLEAALRRCAASNDFAAMDHSGLGKHAFVHTLALSDLRMNRDALARQATGEVLAALRAQDRPAAFAISAAFPELLQTLDGRYELCARLPALHMPTGYSLEPTFVYKRRTP